MRRRRKLRRGKESEVQVLRAPQEGDYETEEQHPSGIGARVIKHRIGLKGPVLGVFPSVGQLHE